VKPKLGNILSLSPDGQWLAAATPQQLCIYAVATQTRQSCTPIARVDSHSIIWSPDSTRLAFTENAPIYLVESDLWVFDVTSGTLTNLTDDGVEQFKLDERDGLLDLAPAWSPDSQTLIFSRTTFQPSGARTGLYRIAAAGGSPTKVLDVLDAPLAVWHSLRWPSRGNAITYTVMGNEPQAASNGIWMAGLDGSNPQQVLGTTDPQLGPPFLVAVSPAGDQALVWYYQVASQFASTDAGVPYWSLLDTTTRAVTPLQKLVPDDNAPGRVVNAIFSPDGSQLLYAYRVDNGCQLMLRDLDGNVEHTLLTVDEPCGTHTDFGRGLDWAQDNTVLVALVPLSRGLLLQLAAE
jgi:Tol biopolymer transport system component